MSEKDLRGDWGDQIATLRALTAATGTLHEAQIMQLKYWGGLSFSHLGSWDCAVDVARKVVEYRLREGGPKKYLARVIAALDLSVHGLLGDEWALHVTHAGKPLYEGARLVTNAEKTNERRKAGIEGRGAGEGDGAA